VLKASKETKEGEEEREVTGLPIVDDALSEGRRLAISKKKGEALKTTS